MGLFSDTRGIRHRRSRPHGMLPDENQLIPMLDSVKAYVAMLKEHPEVEAISLGGGLSRGYSDELSEIDLNVYVRTSVLVDWEMGKGPIPHGDHMGEHFHMDVTFSSLEKERGEPWSLIKKWDASYVKILYDPDGSLNELLDSKDVFTAEEKHGVALRNYLDCVYYGDIVVRQWTNRRDALVANQMLSKGLHSLCNLLFLANDEYPPFEKWLVNYCYSLEWKPKDWMNRLQQVTLIKEISFNELERRKHIFKKMYHEVWGRIVGEEYRETGLLELEALETLRYVMVAQPSVEEFNARYSHKQLGYEVLFKLADIIEVDGRDYIIFNEEAYLKEKESGFPSFLNWNKKMLEHVH